MPLTSVERPDKDGSVTAVDEEDESNDAPVPTIPTSMHAMTPLERQSHHRRPGAIAVVRQGIQQRRLFQRPSLTQRESNTHTTVVVPPPLPYAQRYESGETHATWDSHVSDYDRRTGRTAPYHVPVAELVTVPSNSNESLVSSLQNSTCYSTHDMELAQVVSPSETETTPVGWKPRTSGVVLLLLLVVGLIATVTVSSRWQDSRRGTAPSNLVAPVVPVAVNTTNATTAAPRPTESNLLYACRDNLDLLITPLIQEWLCERAVDDANTTSVQPNGEEDYALTCTSGEDTVVVKRFGKQVLCDELVPLLFANDTSADDTNGTLFDTKLPQAWCLDRAKALVTDTIQNLLCLANHGNVMPEVVPSDNDIVLECPHANGTVVSTRVKKQQVCQLLMDELV